MKPNWRGKFTHVDSSNRTSCNRERKMEHSVVPAFEDWRWRAMLRTREQTKEQERVAAKLRRRRAIYWRWVQGVGTLRKRPLPRIRCEQNQNGTLCPFLFGEVWALGLTLCFQFWALARERKCKGVRSSRFGEGCKMIFGSASDTQSRATLPCSSWQAGFVKPEGQGAKRD